MKEAAHIFLQLRDDPENPELQARRDAFLARGEAEKAVYGEILKTWKASGVMHVPRTMRSVAVLCCVLIGAAYFAYDPLRIAILADVSTQSAPEQTTLASGDIAFLDAASALVDETDGASRTVELLDGAAFFDVAAGRHPFVVDLGDVVVTVVGTAFETAFVDDAVVIDVAEGRVDVKANDQIWELSAGERLHWTDTRGAEVTTHDGNAVAPWRGDRLVVDGMTLGEAAAIIERRLIGTVVFADRALRRKRVTGSLDLSDPLVALRLLAATGNARVFHVPGIGRVIANQ
ncbi:MAG: FecR domain-containing protein [Pseudomonadota bacterium]